MRPIQGLRWSIALFLAAAATVPRLSESAPALVGSATAFAFNPATATSEAANASPDAEASPLPVGRRVVRLPERGTRARVFYPTTAEAARAAKEKGFGSRGFVSLVSGPRSGCAEDAPLALDIDGNEGEGLPLLVYSHGINGDAESAAKLWQTVASRGVIVAAIEHTDGTACSTERPDGSVMRYAKYMMTERQQLTRRASELQEAARYLPVEMPGWSDSGADSDPPAVGPVVLGGIGWGGPSSVMAANGAGNETNIRGLILHDPTLGMGYGMLPPNGSDNRLPTITYVSDKYRKKRVRYGARTVHAKGCGHGNFGDAYLGGPRSWAPNPLSVDPVWVHEQLADSMAAFLCTRDVSSSLVSEGSLLEVVR